MNKFTKAQTNMAKGVAIILMLMYHLFSEAKTLEDMNVIYAPIPKDIFLMIAGFGNICVAIFVLLTAYGITKSIYEKAKEKELNLKLSYEGSIKRFTKLLCNFFIMYVSVNVLWFMMFDYKLLYGAGKQGFVAMLLDATGFAQLFNTPTLNMTWWYMTLAYAFVFLVPLFAYAFKKIGYPMLILGGLLPFIIRMNPDIERYFFVMILGVAAAYGDWFTRLFTCKINKAVRIIIEAIIVILTVLIRQNAFIHDYLLILVDAPIAFIMILFSIELIGIIPVIRNVFEFLGKYSMNMYFVHTFFYLILWRQYIYYFKYAGVSLILLVAVSLLYSFILEMIKKGVLFLYKKLKKTKN